MVQFDNQYRQIKVKVVYYGPALGGKTTCLQHIHRTVDPERRTKLYSLATASDRTLFFDLLALDLGRIRGYQLALQLYTVPGQVQYNATRRAVLSGADGVVFVADSQVGQRDANLAALENLWENLAANGLDRDGMPLVFQYNKRDLDSLLPVEDMQVLLNSRGVPAFPTIAVSGQGVVDGFAAVCEQTLVAVADKLGLGASQQAVDHLRERARQALRPFVVDGEAVAPVDDVTVIRPQTKTRPGKPLSQEVLVGEAVRANMAMTDLNARLDTLGRQLERRARVMAAIAQYGQAVGAEHDPRGVLRLLLETVVRQLRVKASAVLIVPGSGQLREAAVHGLERDPLLAVTDEVGESVAVSILAERKPQLLVPDVDGGGDSYYQAALEEAGFGSGLAVPMVVQDRLMGMLTGYRGTDRTAFDEDDLQLASVLAGTAAMAYANATAWRRLEDVNRDLELQVDERTRELRESLDDVQRLNTELAEKGRAVESAYGHLAELDRVKDELIARISSELKSPVTSLHTAVKILEKNRDAPPEKNARFVTVIRDEAEKLVELIQSIVQASVLATTGDAVSPSPIAAEELFRRAVGPLRDVAEQREVRLQVLIPNDLQTVVCDPATMEVALRAIIRNGIEFNHRSGEVKVEVRRAQRDGVPWLVIRVSDTGFGIPEQDLPHVFESFWQGGNFDRSRQHGIGLGLSIAKRVVEAHRGAVTISSRVEEGTQVTVVMPQEAGEAGGAT